MSFGHNVDEKQLSQHNTTTKLHISSPCSSSSGGIALSAQRTPLARLTQVLTALGKEDRDRFFAEPVNVEFALFTNYHQIVKSPMDFATMLTKIVKNTYGTEVDAYFAGNCTLCPENAVTDQTGATSFEMCKCSRGYYMAGTSPPNAQCVRCPLPGTACTDQGVTLDSLPLEHGYWRPGYSSLDVRPCPDQSEGMVFGR